MVEKCTWWLRSRTTPSCLQEICVLSSRTYRGWKWRDGKNILCSGNQERAGVAVLVSDKILSAKISYKRQRGSLYSDKGVRSSGGCNNCKQHWSAWILKAQLKGDTYSNPVTVGNFDRSPRQKFNKGTADSNNTTDQMDLTDIHRTFHPTAPAYPFFRSAHILQNRSYVGSQSKKAQLI